MSVRTNGTDEYYRRTANLPSSTGFTICGWSRLTLHVSDYQYWGMENATSTSSAYLLIGFTNTGTFEIASNTGNNSFSSAPSDEVWFFWAITCSGTGAGSFNGYWAGFSDTSFKTASTTGASFTPACITLGNDSYTEDVNACYFGVKIWDAVLTSTELWNEMETIRPQRTANLNIWSPLWDANDIKDYSGNGRDWTGAGGSLTSEDNPPISYGSNNLVLPFVSSVVTTTTFRRTESDRIGSRS